jgi:hypothetical protein
MLVGNTVLRGNRYNHWMNRTRAARGSAKKGKEEFALFGLGERLLAAAHLGRYTFLRGSLVLLH